jgi:hypothetical protein
MYSFSSSILFTKLVLKVYDVVVSAEKMGGGNGLKSHMKKGKLGQLSEVKSVKCGVCGTIAYSKL